MVVKATSTLLGIVLEVIILRPGIKETGKIKYPNKTEKKCLKPRTLQKKRKKQKRCILSCKKKRIEEKRLDEFMSIINSHLGFPAILEFLPQQQKQELSRLEDGSNT